MTPNWLTSADCLILECWSLNSFNFKDQLLIQELVIYIVYVHFLWNPLLLSYLRTCKHGVNVCIWLSSTIFVFMQGGFPTTGSYILVDFSIPRAECDNPVFVGRDTGSVRIAYTWISPASICINSSMKLFCQFLSLSNQATLSIARMNSCMR